MSSALGGKPPEGSSGYTYSFGIHMGISRGPVNEVCAAIVGGKLAWTGSVTASGQVYIDNPNLFGGLKKEGGIRGFANIMMGEPGQLPSSALQALCAPAPTPGFRRMLTIHYDGMIAALNPYPKPWSWRIRRTTAGWDGEVLRPDLATINLVGQVVDVITTTPPQKLALGGGIVDVPYIHGTKLTVTSTVPGHPNVTAIASVVDGEGTGANIPFDPNEVVYNPDHTATITLPASTFMKHVVVTYTTESFGGFPVGPIGIDNLLVDQQPNPICVDSTMETGGTGWTLISFSPADAIGPGPMLVGAPVLQPDGVTMRINYDPSFWGRPMRTEFGYFVGGFPRHVIQVLDPKNLHPAVIEIAAPPNTTYVSTWRVTTTRADNDSTPPQDFTVSDLTWTEEGIGATANIGRIGITDIAKEGQKVAVNIYYLPPAAVANDLDYDPNIKAMNGSHMIFECLTNREWGRGLDRSVINIPSFEAAAQTLFNEGFGLCMRWSRSDSIESFVQTILNHIGAALYSDRETALLTIKLIRGDYAISDLPLYDTSNGIITISDSAVNAAGVVVNEIKVTWHDPIYDEDRTVNEQNLASLVSSGGAFNSMSKSYTGLPTADLARRIALRDLRAQAEGLRKFHLQMDRRAWKITPGQVFRIQDGPRNIPDTVVRVARVEDGTLQNGVISMDVVQDVFSFPAQSFTEDQPNTWLPPNHTPCIGRHLVFEMPYFLLAGNMTAAELATVTPTSAYIGTVAELGQPANVAYDIAVRDSAPTVEDTPVLADQLYCGYIP